MDKNIEFLNRVNGGKSTINSSGNASYVCVIGPTEATEFLANKADGCRSSSALARKFLDAIHSDCFLHGTQIRVVSQHGTLRVVDGISRLKAITMQAKSFPFVVTVINGDEDPDAIKNEVAKFGAIGKGRTLVNALDAIDAKHLFAGGKKSALASACRIIARNFSTDPHQFVHPRMIAELAMHYAPAVERVVDWGGGTQRGSSTRGIYRSTVMSICLYTTRHALGLSQTFWPRVLEDSELKRTDPRKVLSDYLRERQSTTTDRKHCMRVVSECWNAHVDERPLAQTPKGYGVRDIKATPYELIGTGEATLP